MIMLNKEIEDTMKIVKSLEESDLLIKDVSETFKNEAEEQKVDFSEFYYVHQMQVYQEICQLVKE